MSGDALDQTSITPLYIQLKELLSAKIHAGEYPPGSIIPSEAELGSMFGVSRITIRSAIAELVEEGLLVRKQGKGTFVSGPKIERTVSELYGFTQLCGANGMKASSHVLCARRAPATRRDIEQLKLAPGDEVIFIHRVCYADNRPVMIEYNYLPARFDALLEENLENRSLYDILAERHNVRLNPANSFDFVLSLEVATADEEEAGQLGLAAGSPLFLVRELVCSHTGQPVHRTKQLLAGDYFRYTFRHNNTTPTLEML